MKGSGQYREKVTFVDYTVSRGTDGGSVQTERELLSTYAMVSQTRGGQQINNGQVFLAYDYEIRIRQREAFTPATGMLIRYKGGLLEIKSVMPLDEQMRKEFQIMALKVKR